MQEPKDLFWEIKKARIRYYRKIAKKGKNHLFLEDWLKRITCFAACALSVWLVRLNINRAYKKNFNYFKFGYIFSMFLLILKSFVEKGAISKKLYKFAILKLFDD
ncbi:MAG: hypothetical protein MI922_07580 [Bacteroidales bacterium]|nr:hypothetical protein [Bacteroidales bacterium]